MPYAVEYGPIKLGELQRTMKQPILVEMVRHKSRSRTTGVVSPNIGRLMTRSPDVLILQMMPFSRKK
ncbi:hypothetical protein HanRHA438_Chr17g0839231 [Helianthus annuus]|uniref:Uncharacterized protein n=1 Tax=Helianthus annuus TaxID=4232 RepID=A0A251RUD5_HELAN|nr:hypothetical protein HanXRQr2_Chr17g0828611 [Helianthus annuus]KAJ0430961.1 hypothetical protein HanHA300_Chr17g0675011 [Helianthus annuus]KAJ0449409.1 hypothetical protein HanHA89_Chr17g0728121 [Helianthus annuus]KAJ0634266.1 hypothetical protein HanLR1_Chr17g0686151 [Helianthus annuus]KAJ0828619.1 hypothetical protein HanRHA438_Chr17g0839231 [Helianthus annuus]